MSHRKWIAFVVSVSSVVAVGGSTWALSEELSKFFANESVQRTHPQAFVLQPEAETFLRNLESDTRGDRDRLVSAIEGEPDLLAAVRNWESLTFAEQEPILRRIFSLEVQYMNIVAPDLRFDAAAIPGRAAFFDFDVNRPDAGRVILNPEVLRSMPKYDALALLIHETRHSAQFQLAFDALRSITPAAEAYRAAFRAQKDGVRGFCDFLTLANEFEAFQFGNYVLGRLTGWTLEMPDMGTFASQYGSDGRLKLDLVRLLEDRTGVSLLRKFNEAEIVQCRLLGACPAE